MAVSAIQRSAYADQTALKQPNELVRRNGGLGGGCGKHPPKHMANPTSFAPGASCNLGLSTCAHGTPWRMPCWWKPTWWEFFFLDRSKLVWFDIWGYICLKGEWSPTKPSCNHLNNQPHCTRIHAWAFLGPPLQQPLPFHLYTHSSTYLLSYFTQFLHFWC